MICDTLVVGGSVYDASQGLAAATRDIAIKDGLVLDIAPSITPEGNCDVIDATGRIVLPGLVNIHVHVAHPLFPSTLGVNIDNLAPRAGYTSVVDAGSAGKRNAAQLLAAAAQMRTRVLAFLNVSRIGMADSLPGSEFADGTLDEALEISGTARFLAAHADFFLGLKVRLFSGADDIHRLERAIAIAEKAEALCAQAGTPRRFKIMVHVGGLFSSSTIDQVVALLRPGDIITHVHTAVRNPQGLPTGFALNGVVRQSAFEAMQKGIILDMGASTGPNNPACDFDPYTYGVCAKVGVQMSTISADEFNIAPTQGPLWSMPQLAGLVYALNEGSHVSPLWAPSAGPILQPLAPADLFRMMTLNPALVIGDRGPFGLGTLKAGAPADLVVMRGDTGSFSWVVGPPSSCKVTGTVVFVVEKTMKGGALL